MKGFARIASLCLYSCITVKLAAQLPAAQQKAIVLKRVAELYHFSPRPVNDSFSAFVFKSLLNATDRRRLFLTQEEYKALAVYTYSIDEELQGSPWRLLNHLSTLYKKSLYRADSIVKDILQKPIDFAGSESITTSAKPGEFNFAATTAELRNRWARYLKWISLNQLYSAVSADSAFGQPLKTLTQRYETKIREKIKANETKMIKALLEPAAGFDKALEQQLLNAIATAFDPHTNYFSPEQHTAFKEELSADASSFGLELDENDKGQIIIDHLVPGGPAWKNGELNKGDELLQVQLTGKPPTEMTGLSLEEAYDLLDDPATPQLQFRFRKTSGIIKQVTLRKEKISNEENIVKSFVLAGEKKIGYILLPGFYTDWESESGSSCANDVAKEIVKLKKEKIDGLVLDLRYNGGGSVGEALDMAGIFIDEGPLCGERTRNGKLSFIKDVNRGTIYDGPLVLMVNGQSASASELLAAALQDYNRAVIAGSTTYGKATFQEIVAADTLRKAGSGSGDFVKLTIGKLFRLTGLTAQLNGVVPDVALPDIFEGLDYREKAEPAALKPDTVTKNNYYKPLPALPLSQVAAQSAARVKQDLHFQTVEKQIQQRKEWLKAGSITIPLQWSAFEKWMKKKEMEEEALEDAMTAAGKSRFKAGNHAADQQLIKASEYGAELNQYWLENLEEDIYLQEAYSIACDLAGLLAGTIKK
jgi:carboxyl-terminal processing protease